MLRDISIEKEREYPKLEIRANTLDEEISHAWNKIKRIEFFNKFGYNLFLPETENMKYLINKSIENKLEDTDIDILKTEIAKVYDYKFYEKGLFTAKNSLGMVKNTFAVFKDLAEKWGFKLFDEYIIRLTQFGPGGSYDSKHGHVIIKTNKEGLPTRRKDPVGTVVHEIVHIGIEDEIIQKYNIPHETKERIVDEFMIHYFIEIFPDYFIQRIGDERITKYLSFEDSWDRLPHYIELFAKENLSK